jgi:hypothetical protein
MPDQFPQIIEAFGVKWYPFCGFYKEKKSLSTPLMGSTTQRVHTLKFINSYADTSSEKQRA